MKLKKALSALGLMVVSISPVAAVVACGDNSSSPALRLDGIITKEKSDLKTIIVGEGADFRDVLFDQILKNFPQLDRDAVDISESTFDVTSTVAHVVPKQGTSKYRGSAQVTFNFQEDRNLGDLIDPSVGQLVYQKGATNSTDLEDLLLAAIIAANGDKGIFLTDVAVSGAGTLKVTDTSATIVSANADKYHGSVEVHFAFALALDSLITKQQVKVADETDAAILAGVNVVNLTNLTVNEINVDKTGSGTAELTGKDGSGYAGTVTISFKHDLAAADLFTIQPLRITPGALLSAWDATVIADFNAHNLFRHLSVGATVQYYLEGLTTPLPATATQDTPPDFVNITAAPDDTYWAGTTVDVALSSLHDLSTAAPLDFTPDIVPSDPLTEWDDLVVEAFGFENAEHPLTGTTVVRYYSDAQAQHLISGSTLQDQISTVYVTISVTDDEYWTGVTLPVLIAEHKHDLKTAAGFLFNPITIDPTKLLNAWDVQIVASFNNTNSSHHLSGTPVVRFYDSATLTTELPGDSTYQNPSQTVYVTITADATDLWWTGTTEPVKMGVIKIDLVHAVPLAFQVAVDTTQKISAWNNGVINAFDTANPTHKLTGTPEINYYGDAGATDLLDADTIMQTANEPVWVTITVSDDSYWDGVTTPVKIDVQKHALTTATAIALNPASDPDQYLVMWDAELIAAFDNANPGHGLGGTPTLAYYSDAQGQNSLQPDLVKQAVNTTYYVAISADATDPYWSGTTSLMSFTSQKADLADALAFTVPLQAVNPAQALDEWDAAVIAAFNQDNGQHTLATGATVNYYTTALGGTVLDKTVVHQGEEPLLYVDITAAPTDAYWTATTTPRVQLLQGEDLANAEAMTIATQTIQPFASLGEWDAAVIAGFNDANPDHNLSGDATVEYFDTMVSTTPVAKTEKQLDHHPVYVEIRVGATDQYWTGKTVRQQMPVSEDLGLIGHALNGTLQATAGKTVSDWNHDVYTILSAHLTPSLTATTFTVQYKDTAGGNALAPSTPQTAGVQYFVYLTIAPGDDAYWYGTTPVMYLQS